MYVYVHTCFTRTYRQHTSYRQTLHRRTYIPAHTYAHTHTDILRDSHPDVHAYLRTYVHTYLPACRRHRHTPTCVHTDRQACTDTRTYAHTHRHPYSCNIPIHADTYTRTDVHTDSARTSPPLHIIHVHAYRIHVSMSPPPRVPP